MIVDGNSFVYILINIVFYQQFGPRENVNTNKWEAPELNGSNDLNQVLTTFESNIETSSASRVKAESFVINILV